MACSGITPKSHWGGPIGHLAVESEWPYRARYYKNGKVTQRGDLKNGMKVGPWETYKDGVWVGPIFFLDGRPQEGLKTNWYPNGQLRSEEEYKNGEPVGRWIEWYENGQKVYEHEYKNGKKEGLWTVWWHEPSQQGRIQSRGRFREGERCGFWIHEPSTITISPPVSPAITPQGDSF